MNRCLGFDNVVEVRVRVLSRCIFDPSLNIHPLV